MKLIYQAGILLLMMTVISGILYPALVTGIGQLIWAENSNGSLIKKGNGIIGSALLAQQFKQTKYFWPRPSAGDFSTVPSGASNLSPTSVALAEAIARRRSELAKIHEVAMEDISVDLLTTSASGLDPHISKEAALLQVKRIVAARNLDEKGKATIQKLINDYLEERQLGFLGEKRINVLSLNLGLDQSCDRD